MILYVFQSNAYIYPILLHRLVVNRDKEAVLFADANFLKSRGLLDQIRNFELNNLFSKVCFPVNFSPVSIWNDDENTSIQKFLEINDKNLKNTGYSFSDFEKIYTAVDDWDLDFMLYLNLKEINYHSIQTWVNRESTPIESMPNNKRKIIMKYNAYGWSSQFATPVLLSESEQSISSCNKPYELWNPKIHLEQLSVADLDLIMESYQERIPEMNPTGSTFLVKNSNSVMQERIPKIFVKKYEQSYRDSYMKRTNMILIDTIALDYFTKNSKIYVKTHPNDPIDSQQLLELYGTHANPVSKMPMELFSKALANRQLSFDLLLAYVSTSLSTLDKNIFENTIILGAEFLKIWMEMHEIYIAVCIALQEFPDFEIYCADSLLDTINLLLDKESYPKRAKSIRKSELRQLKNVFLIYNEVSSPQTSDHHFLHSSVISCFLNITESYYFFNEKDLDKYVSVKVKKKKLQKTLDPCVESIIWLYSSSHNLYPTLKDLNIRKELSFTGIEINAELMPVSDTSHKLDLSKKEKIIRNLNKRVERLYCFCSKFESFFVAVLPTETDFESYLDLLNAQKKNFLIIFSIKDTPGNQLSESVVQNIKNLGCGNFDKKLWTTYIGIIDKGRVVFDEATYNEEATYFSDKKLNLQVASKSWRNGNQAEICLRDVDYAVNRRGVNIVVWDKRRRKLVDSVAFDAHDISDAICYRK